MADKENKSVRSKITAIEGNLGDLTSSLQAQNNNSLSLISISQEILDVSYQYLRPMEDNIRLMAQAILGLDITDAKGNKVDINAMRGQGGLGAMKEAAAEAKKEDDQDDKVQEKQLSKDEEALAELKGLRKDLKKGGLLDLLIGGGAFIAGSIIGLAQKYIEVFKAAFKPIINLFRGDGSRFEKMISVVRTGWTKFTAVFASLGDWLASGKTGEFLSKGVELVKRIGSGFAKLGAYFVSIGDLIKEGYAGLKALTGGGGGFIGKIVEFFKRIGGTFKYFLKFGMIIGRRILFPIIAIYDTVMGALDGWEKDGIFGAIKGGISGLINSIFGSILDLLKDGVSWIIEAIFGENDVSKALDSFSFQDIISEAIDGLVDMLMTPVRVLQDLMKAFSGEVDWGTTFKSVISRIVAGVLAPAEGLAKRFGIDLTDKVLNMMGLPKPPAAGSSAGANAPIASTPEKGTATIALEKTMNENVAAKDEQAAKNAGGAVVVTTNNSPVINNNSSSTAVLRAKTTNWEPDDQWARGGGASWIAP